MGVAVLLVTREAPLGKSGCEGRLLMAIGVSMRALERSPAFRQHSIPNPEMQNHGEVSQIQGPGVATTLLGVQEAASQERSEASGKRNPVPAVPR